MREDTATGQTGGRCIEGDFAIRKILLSSNLGGSEHFWAMGKNSLLAPKRTRFPTPASMQHAVVSETLKGIRRTLGTAQPAKEPLLTADIRQMLDALGDGLLGSRDRALLLVGFAGGFRRSEIVSLDVEDVSETADGLVVRVRRSKTVVLGNSI